MIASFRASIGPDADDPRIAQLVGELSLASEPFRKLWARHDVRNLAGGAVTMHHPEIGPLELWREKLPIGDSGGQLLVLYHAEPGSASAAALDRLAPAATRASGQALVSGPAVGDASRRRARRTPE
jgi:MmyB-like transcription regulator ligand binding domain